MAMEDEIQVLDQTATLQSSPIVRRYPGNPILTSADMPYPSRLVYNAGVTKFRDHYVMVFRNDYGYDERLQKAPHFQLGLAYSDDGIKWNVEPEPILAAWLSSYYRRHG
jgi:beta-1,4-mannooligosaccharide/beta-1,4-mannosyl-N-acetylglucosamine phosphorylase